ncbi:Trafficking protein particle complex subunit 6B [Hypsizygus marmoreus]|uniref:Trafficking protein particle complex subunit 6B n=1 Tax=Hypsizygus marmoreus TaxID=39966 RepID=A0A369JY69_HYPMA|nr:Trafficking protein particle complex subunit 6B [Hypsizygus marmoreus]
MSRSSIQTAPPLSASSLVPANLAALADPPTKQIDAAVMDYFLIELVNTLRVSSAVATARSKKIEQEMVEAGLIPAPMPTSHSLPLKKESARDSVTSLKGKAPAIDEEEEAVRTRLEAIGIHVGANFTERLCRDRPLFSETLDAIKFVCKDIWAACWEKQVDNLRTNHRGIYVLQDNAFKPISRLSSWEGRAEAIKRAKLYVAMPAGIIRGALSRLGFHGAVAPEVTMLPQCVEYIPSETAERYLASCSRIPHQHGIMGYKATRCADADDGLVSLQEVKEGMIPVSCKDEGQNLPTEVITLQYLYDYIDLGGDATIYFSSSKQDVPTEIFYIGPSSGFN